MLNKERDIMRVEDGIRYYEDGECIMSGADWNYGVDDPGAAIAYHLEGDLVCIVAETVTQKDIRKIWKIFPEYKDREYVVLRRANIGKLLLL